VGVDCDRRGGGGASRDRLAPGASRMVNRSKAPIGRSGRGARRSLDGRPPQGASHRRVLAEVGDVRSERRRAIRIIWGNPAYGVAQRLGISRQTVHAWIGQAAACARGLDLAHGHLAVQAKLRVAFTTARSNELGAPPAEGSGNDEAASGIATRRPRPVTGVLLAAPATAGGACTQTGSDASDNLRGTSGNDILCGSGGDDRLAGRGGDDRLRGEGGSDLLIGGSGGDALRGGEDGDTLIGGPGIDRLSGGVGAYLIDASGGGADVVRGGGGRDVCYVDANDEVHGCNEVV